MTDSKIIVALDFPDEASTMKLIERINPGLCRLKIGKELFTRCGPDLVKKIVNSGYDVFLDLKYHDIPNTDREAEACKTIYFPKVVPLCDRVPHPSALVE